MPNVPWVRMSKDDVERTDRAGSAPGMPQAETATFGQLVIEFDARVPRPRPWTTAQSYWAAELLRSAPAGRVLELCAGAGQIGLLAVAEGDRELLLVDLDPTACAYAHSNARRAGLADRVVVRQAALHEAVEPGERFAVVIADPPWVPSGAVGRLPEDPLLAIDGGPDGLATAWICLEVAAVHLVGGGSVVVQLGSEAQVAAVRDRLDDGSLGLEFAESRAYGTNGMLVHLRRAAHLSGLLTIESDEPTGAALDGRV